MSFAPVDLEGIHASLLHKVEQQLPEIPIVMKGPRLTARMPKMDVLQEFLHDALVVGLQVYVALRNYGNNGTSELRPAR